MAVSFDLFGTLVAVDEPSEPAAAVAAALRARDVPVPDDWATAYREMHVDVEAGAEMPLPDHVEAALASRGVAGVETETIRNAVAAAFDPDVGTRPGAVAAVEGAAEQGRVGIMSNCSVPGLVARALDRSAVDSDQFDAIVTSVGCGWRKPDSRAFAAVADELGTPLESLVHVGDDPATDGGAADAGATALLVDDVPLSAVPDAIEEERP